MPDSDLALLTTFSERRSDTAFGSLVCRHLDRVHSVAFRLTRDRHLAEDVSQAVFLALAHQASQVARKVASGTPLAAWLHLTTRNLAAKRVRTEARRRAREQASATLLLEPDPPDPSAEDWRNITDHLDHMRDGHLEAAMGLHLLSPTDRAELEETLLGNPAERDAMAERMASEVNDLIAVELLGVEPLSDRRSTVTLRRLSATATNALRMEFGQTPAGWKELQVR